MVKIIEHNSESLGTRYNQGKLQWSLVDFKSLEPMVEVLMYGAHKYSVFVDKEGKEYKGSGITPEQAKDMLIKSSGKNNWKKGLPVTEICESMLRHIYSFLDGNITDNESNQLEVGHILCNAMFLSYMMQNKVELDDRYKGNI